MDLNKLYKLQEELDRHILEKNKAKISKEKLLDYTMLALLVEVGELANTTRCFKHWSKKGMMEKEIVLDELADVWHFYLSIGNQRGWDYKTQEPYLAIEEINISDMFTSLYYNISRLSIAASSRYNNYKDTGEDIFLLSQKLGFTDEEVEQAYLTKHEENYKRQEGGY